MKIGNKGVKVLRKMESRDLGIRVELTSKMTVAGRIIKALVVTNVYTGGHIVLATYDNLKEALKNFKQARRVFIINPELEIRLRNI